MTDLLLYCHAESSDLLAGRWQFSLESEFGEPLIEASDQEQGDLNRLALWSAVRGLEAVDGARSLTLLSSSRYLIRSMTDSLPRWRNNHFVWEHFGRYVEVQNADLWRRIDRALTIHRVAACLMQTQMVSPAKNDDFAIDDLSTDPLASIPSRSVQGDAIIRVDGAHRHHQAIHPANRQSAESTAALPRRRRQPGTRPAANRVAVDDRAASSIGDTPLRRMLASKSTPPTRRFTAEQLAAT